MKATEAKLLAFLKRSPQLVIPIYQRNYSWTSKECRQLWDDVLRAGSSDSIAVHFVGSIVYVEQGLSQVSHQSPLLVIDGQQRLTSVSLLIAALANALGDEEPVDGFSARKLRNYYLLNPDESGERHYKLLLSQTDKATLTSIVSGGQRPHEVSVRVEENFKLFTTWLNEHKGALSAVCHGLAKLVVVDIALSREHDNPQLIFESMNSTGRELSQADLIRNYILMGLEPTLQTRLYEEYWRPMELGFGQEAYASHFDGFMRHYLTVQTGTIPNLSDVYDAFKAHAQRKMSSAADVEALVRELREYAGYYCAITLGAETEPRLKNAFQDLRDLKVDVAYPFLLELYRDYQHGALAAKDFEQAVRLVEAYVFRRAICAIPTNSLNKTFATFTRTVDKQHYLESIAANFLQAPSYRRFPNDEEFRQEIRSRDLYSFRGRGYWLRRLENHGRKERVAVDEYTIEHILPQNEDLSAAWREALGPDWKRIQQTWLHTLGNLTLTGYNSEYSDHPFEKKRDMRGGFKESPLKLNAGLGLVATWNEEQIKARADRLAELALDAWPAPRLSDDALARHRNSIPPPQAKYSIDDHPQLSTDSVRQLFEALRKEILALDPCVTEEFLKLYIAYKAETNFIDVVPQAKRLRLSLNLPFREIHDPKQRCKDVSGVGRWGNGEVELFLSSLEELPYVMGLVRQSLERQMGSGAASP